MAKERIRTSFKQNIFTGVAFWQLMVFILLLCFAWANELLDLPSIVFGSDPGQVDYFRLSFLSAGIITAAIVAIGHTYERQKSVAQNLVGSCPYCHRVQTANKRWQNVHDYFDQHYLLDVNKGFCPECAAMVEEVNQKQTDLELSGTRSAKSESPSVSA